MQNLLHTLSDAKETNNGKQFFLFQTLNLFPQLLLFSELVV